MLAVPGVGVPEPLECNLAITVTPSTIPAGPRQARVRIPVSLPDVQFRASSGTASVPVRPGNGFMVADFTAAPDSPPLALVAVVGTNVCGFSIIRIRSAAAIQPAGAPVALVVVDPAEANADRDADVLVYVFAVDDRGARRRGTAPTLRPSFGSIGRVESLAPGAWRGRWHLPPGEAMAAAVTATFDGWETPAVASLARTPGSPLLIEITQDPAGGTGTPAAVVVRIRDAAGNLTEGPLELTSDVAQMGAPVQLERGVFRAPLVVPPGMQRKAFAVTATAGRAAGTATFSIMPSTAATIRVTPPGPILADGSTEGAFEVLDVVVVDAFDKPATDVPVGSGGGGEFRGALSVGPGHWALLYRPPRVSRNTTERVVVAAGAASTTVDLDLRARRLSVSLGLKGGVAIAGGSLGPAAGVEVAAWTLVGRTQLGLVLDVSWSMHSTTSTATVGGAALPYEASQKYLPVLLSVGWRTPYGAPWVLWATLGGGGARVSNSSQVGGQPTLSESGFAPAVSASLSAGPSLGPGALFLEARATWIGDAKLSTLSGSSTSVLGLLGYRFDVG